MNEHTWPIDQAGLAKIRRWLEQAPLDGSWRVKFEKNEVSRSDAQNRLSFLWYDDMARETGSTKQDMRRHCKLVHGCPLLQRDDNDFAHEFEAGVSHRTYEEQLKAMDYLPVTRLFKVKQFTEYLEAIEAECAEQNIPLRYPQDIYYMALGQ